MSGVSTQPLEETHPSGTIALPFRSRTAICWHAPSFSMPISGRVKLCAEAGLGSAGMRNATTTAIVAWMG